MTNPTQSAQDRFAQGFNCSQSVFSAYASQLGIDDQAALKLASPFGGGVAHQGDVCGAVTGALMALGLDRGNATLEAKDETYRIAEKFIERFKERHGTILCRQLIGHDISTPEGLQNARGQNVFKSICPGLVKDATELVAEFLDE
ncbi:MAG: C_GCAxxG_C_C family protein [Anaerolineales bacterium]|nr:C_GCAxxG_C_C family protein [Anaerolineales bacterium]